MLTKFKANSIPNVVTIYNVVRKTVWSIAEKEDLLLFINDGECIFEVNGEEYHLKKGDLMFLPKGTQYLRKPINNEFYAVYYIHFFANYEDISLTDAQKQLVKLSAENNNDNDTDLYLSKVVNCNDCYDLIVSVLERAIALREKEEVKFSLYVNTAVQYIITLMAEKSQHKIVSGLKTEKLETFPDPLKDAVFYIKKHLNEKITLDSLCKVSLVSPQQLIRYFKKYTGKTPNAYITDYKINVARDYITGSKELSIKTIAYELGFDDQCYFSRVFSKTTGESPTEYYYRVKNFNAKNQT